MRLGPRARPPALAMIVLLALAGSGCDRTDDGQPAAPPDTPPTAAATAEPAPSPTEDARVLEDKWYVDSNGDGVPDFIEEAAGYDPQIDDCAAEIDCPGPAGASALDLAREQNTLLLLDASGSMAGPAGGGQTKMVAAREALERYATATPDFVNLGFLVYGHKGSNDPSGKAESCAGVDVLAPLGEVDHATFGDVLASFDATGYTPIAGALQTAEGAFAGREDADNRVIMVSDGIETCDGDPVAAARSLAEAGIAVTVDVVGFAVEDTDVEQLQAIAGATGGTYTDAPTGDALQDYFQGQYEQLVALTDQYGCVVQQANAFQDCTSRYLTDVQQRMTQEAIDESDLDRNQAINDLRDRVSVDLRASRDAFIAQTREQRAEISAAVDEVRRRMRERYGEDISALLTCPANQQLAHAAAAGPHSG